MNNTVSDVFEDEGLTRPENYSVQPSSPELPTPTVEVQNNQIGDVFADEGVDGWILFYYQVFCLITRTPVVHELFNAKASLRCQ